MQHQPSTLTLGNFHINYMTDEHLPMPLDDWRSYHHSAEAERVLESGGLIFGYTINHVLYMNSKAPELVKQVVAQQYVKGTANQAQELNH